MNSRMGAVDADLSEEDEELLKYLLASDAETASTPVLARRPEGMEPPLSFAQQRLWVLDRLEGDNPSFHLSIALGLEGPLDRDALRAALEAVVVRHEVLRTRFVMMGDEPVQRVSPSLSLGLPDTDLGDAAPEAQAAALASILAELVREPFDLENGPLIRVRLVKLGPESHRLLLVLHHTVSDRWSMLILGGEIAALYGAFATGGVSPLAQLPVQYGDYARWERERLQGARLEALLAYWRRRLTGLERLELPLDRPRPAHQTFAGAYESTMLPAASVREIDRIAQENGATRFMALLAVLAAVLSRFSGQSDIAVGTPTSSRSEPALERLIGLFLNTLVLRVDCSDDPSFTELLGRVRETTLGAYAHQDAPFERIVHDLSPARALNRSPLFEVLFVQVDQALSAAGGGQRAGDAAPATFGSVRVSEETPSLDEHKAINDESVQYDLEVYARETSEGLRVNFVYNVSLFDVQTVRRMLEQFRIILARVAESPARRLSQLTSVAGDERRLLLEVWNATAAEYPRDKAVHELFEAQARRTPQRIAVVHQGLRLSYAALEGRANALAQVLRGRGVGRGQRVGLCLERGVEMLAAVLGVLKSGAAYVPLDPAFPQARLRFMVQDAELALLMSTRALAGQFDLPLEQLLLLDADAGLIDSASQKPLPRDARGARPEDPAYVIYTSGSTGEPKGVVVPHRAVVNFLTSMARAPRLSADDVLVAVTTLSFDIAVLELQLPLACGATVVIATRDEAADGRALGALLQASGASVMQATPSTWRLLIETGWSGRAGFKALVGGEALPKDLAEQLLARGVELWNMYGPTETTVWSSCARISDAGKPITIGKPIANTVMRVLDAQGNLCPIGVPGELYIGGDGLSLGYWKRAELTAQKFVADAYADTAGAILYRTGDRARWRDDGSLEHLGRLDDQIKLRGYRIELGEIEAVLRQAPAIREAAALVREDVPGDRRLVAYVVAHEAAPDDLHERLRARLRASLPEYMVPAQFVSLQALPLTPNGKLDRRALPVPKLTGTPAARYVAPRTPTEETLAGIWAEVLKLERVGVDENFFDLGGHSLLVVVAIERMRARTGIALQPREYWMQNLRQIAACYDRERSVPAMAERPGEAGDIAATDVEPVYFGRGGSPLFGCFHPARAPVPGGTALVICQPFGQEYVRCHRLFRVLAASLAQAGLPVLRFDYYGCGDSHGDNEDATLARCVADVGDAVRYVRERTHARNVDLLGLRLGAAIALRFAAQCDGQIARVAVWDPIVRGEDFLASMREQSASFAKWMKRVFRRAAGPGEADGPRDFVGFRFSEALVSELKSLDLLQIAARPCRRVLILDNGADPAATELNDHLEASGVPVELERLSSPRIWLAEPYQGLVPRGSLERLSRWLLETGT